MIWTFEDLDAGRCTVADVGQVRFDPAPEPPSDIPSDAELAFEIAPFSKDPRVIREHQTKRLHEIGEAMARRALDGDIQATRAFVAVSERLSKVQGLDAPKEISLEVARREETIPRQLTTAELEAALAQNLGLAPNTTFSTDQIKDIHAHLSGETIQGEATRVED